MTPVPSLLRRFVSTATTIFLGSLASLTIIAVALM
jgi:hypothetical protein